MDKRRRNRIRPVDIHGSAKFASYEDIQKLESKAQHFLNYERDDSWDHCLVIGPTGAGKSKFIIPNLLKFKGSVLVFKFDRK